MTVATYNVNSIKARLERVLPWLSKLKPDIVCLQELKVTDENFPFDKIAGAGYHAAVHGQRTYNGVAVLSRYPIDDVVTGMDDGSDDRQARLLTVSTGGVTVISAYVPNGQVVGSEKWSYKLDWYARLKRYIDDRHDPAGKVLLCGDFNVAPDDRDVARPERWAESVLCHADGRRALEDVVGWGFVDTVRALSEGPGPYSWWDYRRLAFPKGDGLRIDHILATASMADVCRSAFVDRDERKGPKPSDHAPVVAVFD